MELSPLLFIKPEMISLFSKVAILVVIAILGISALMLATKIRSFNKILFLPPYSGGSFVQRMAIFYFITIGVLFLLALLVL